MTDDIDRELLRRLAGELDEAAARRLDERLAADPALAHRAERLAATWRAAAPPPAVPVPPGFTGRVMARVREEPVPGALLPTGRLRWAGAAALVAGLVLGGGLGQLAGSPAGEPAEATLAASAAEVTDELAGSYLAEGEDVPSLGEDYVAALAAIGEEGS